MKSTWMKSRSRPRVLVRRSLPRRTGRQSHASPGLDRVTPETGTQAPWVPTCDLLANVLLLGMVETIQLSTIVTEQPPAEEPAVLVLKVVREHQALPFLEIAALTGLRISVLKAAVKELADKKMVKLYGPDEPSHRVVGVSGS